MIETSRTAECPTRSRSLWRRVRTVLLATSLLLVCSAAFAAPAKHASVTLDVKDVDVHLVLKSIQKQCSIPSLVIDPAVTGSGTFLFHDLSCDVALRTVLKTTGLAMESHSGSVVAVRPR